MTIFPLGVVWGRSAPSVNLGPPHIPEAIRARKLKFYTNLEGTIPLVGNENFPLGACVGAQRSLLSIWDPLISGKLLELES